MLNIFKDLRNWYLLVSVGGGALIALLMTFAHFRDLTIYIVVLVWALFMGWLFTKQAGKRAQALSQLRNNCQLREYIARYSAILEKLRSGTPADSMVRLNLASGYLDIGDNVSAANLMRAVEVNPRMRSGKPIAAVYHNNYSLIFLREGDFANAEKALAASRAIVADGVPDREKARFEEICKIREAQIAIARGDMDKLDMAANVFENSLRRVATPLERSAASYWLAKVWKLRGDSDGEIHYLNMAAKEGGESLYAREAKAALEAVPVDNQGF